MQFFDVIDRRRSIRAFRAAAVERSKLDAVLSAARPRSVSGGPAGLCHSSCRKSGHEVGVGRSRARAGFHCGCAFGAGFLADRRRSEGKYGSRGATLFCLQDATIAAAYVQLAAAAEGLGTCWVGAFDEARVASAINAPAHLRPVALMPLGNADEAPARPPRRPLSELTRRERF